MKASPFLKLALCLATGAFITGCQNIIQPSKTTTAFYDNQVKATVQVSESVNTVAKAIAPDSPEIKKRLDAIAAENTKLRDDIAKARKEADEKNEELKKALKDKAVELSGDLAKFAGTFSGAGPLLGTVTEFVADIAKKKITAATAEITDEQSRLAAKAKDAVRDEMEQRVRKAEERQKKDLELALKEFANLDERQKAIAREELVKLAQSKGIKGAENMTTEQLLAALGATGVGLAGLLRTFGRSRSEPQLAKQGEKISTVDSNLAAVRETVTEVRKNLDELYDKDREIAATLGKHSGRLDDHERRLTKEEQRV